MRDYGSWHPDVYGSFHWNSLVSLLGEHDEFMLFMEFEGHQLDKNYDWGGMAYVTLLHLKTQLSCHNHSSLGMNRLFGRWDLNSWLGVFCESYLCCCWCVLIYFRFGCMNISVLVHNFWKMLMICFQGFFVGCLSIIYQCPPSVLCKLADGDWQLRHRGGEFFFFWGSWWCSDVLRPLA